MFKRIFVLVLLAWGVQLSAQNAISGYVNFENPELWEANIHLKELSLDADMAEHEGKPVAIVKINDDGSFAFRKKYISDSNTLYRLSVKRIREIVGDTVKKEVDFILSNRDFIRFKKGKSLFGSYETSNPAQMEWQKLKNFELYLAGQYLSPGEKERPNRGFVKDSLQILMVKLIGIKQLEHKQLLETDITQNETYYLNLLSELQASDLDPSEYAFLERKLAYLTNSILERKLQESKWINLGLVALIVLLGFTTVKIKRKQNKLKISVLSKQEQTVSSLILQGKSNKEIANELFISLSTVKTHITNIYSKLNVANRQELLQKSTGTST